MPDVPLVTSLSNIAGAYICQPSRVVQTEQAGDLGTLLDCSTLDQVIRFQELGQLMTEQKVINL